MKRILILICAVILTMQTHAQGMVRDGFIEILGKKVDAPEVKLFFSSYEIKSTTGAKYSSTKNGIDIETKRDSVINVTIYKTSAIYGNYTGKLSRGLAFGMTAAQVAGKLGKPTTAYTNSGYSEYAFAGYVITCWFEQGVLTQVSLSPK